MQRHILHNSSRRARGFSDSLAGANVSSFKSLESCAVFRLEFQPKFNHSVDFGVLTAVGLVVRKWFPFSWKM
jgi:hypothetical protein